MTALTAPVEARHPSTPARAKHSPLNPTFDESRRYFENRLHQTLPALDRVRVRCPFHDDKRESLSIKFRKGRWSCFACKVDGGLIHFERKLTNLPDRECWPRVLASIREAPRGRNDAQSRGAALLSDIRAVFDEQSAVRLHSKDLALCLREIKGRPWADGNHGNGLTVNGLARELAEFKVQPHGFRISGKLAKGYERKDFEDAWSRTCPHSALSTVTASHLAVALGET